MTKRIYKGGPTVAEQIAARELACEKILALLAAKPMMVVDVARQLGLTERLASRYLRHLCDMGEVCRAAEIGPKNRQIWQLGREGREPAPRNPSTAFSGVKVVPARQVGMQRHPQDVAFFGPARSA